MVEVIQNTAVAGKKNNILEGLLDIVTDAYDGVDPNGEFGTPPGIPDLHDVAEVEDVFWELTDMGVDLEGTITNEDGSTSPASILSFDVLNTLFDIINAEDPTTVDPTTSGGWGELSEAEQGVVQGIADALAQSGLTNPPVSG